MNELFLGIMSTMSGILFVCFGKLTLQCCTGKEKIRISTLNDIINLIMSCSLVFFALGAFFLIAGIGLLL